MKVTFLLGAVSLACTLVLFVSAFSAVPDTEVDVHCATSLPAVGSEALQTFAIFVLGFLSSLAVKRRQALAKQVDRILRCASDSISSVGDAAASAVFAAGQVRSHLNRPSWVSRDVLVIALAGVLCASCIIGLIISAFIAEPDAAPAEDGLASESSTSVRLFTVSWMFLLAFKLRRELIGLIGDCCLFQPW